MHSCWFKSSQRRNTLFLFFGWYDNGQYGFILAATTKFNTLSFPLRSRRRQKRKMALCYGDSFIMRRTAEFCQSKLNGVFILLGEFANSCADSGATKQCILWRLCDCWCGLWQPIGGNRGNKRRAFGVFSLECAIMVDLASVRMCTNAAADVWLSAVTLYRSRQA